MIENEINEKYDVVIMEEKKYQDREWIYEQYIILKKNTTKIGKEINVTGATIRYWLKRFNIPIRTLNEAFKGRKRVFSEEHKKKISEANKGKTSPRKGKNLSEMHKRKISESSKGKKLSEETKRKLSDFHKGKKLSNEHRKKISEANTGKKRTDKQKQNISKAMKGKNKGKKVSEETKKKISESQLKRKEINGYINSSETRKKISKTRKERVEKGEIEKMIGIKNPMYGKHLSEEHKKKLSEAHLGKELSEAIRKRMNKDKIGKPRSEEVRNQISESLKGEKHWRWNSNRDEVYAPYGENFYNNQLREEKWDLQKGRDLLTGTKLEEGKKSHFHHIDYNKSNDSIDNLCWLANKNHGRITGYLIKTEYYKELLQKNLQNIMKGKVPENWNKKNQELFKQEKRVQLKLIIIQTNKKEKEMI